MPKSDKNINKNKIGMWKQVYISWITFLALYVFFPPFQAGFFCLFLIMIHKCITLAKLLTTLNLIFLINELEIICQPPKTVTIT